MLQKSILFPLFIGLIFACTALSAQESNTKFGLKVGGNYANLYGDNDKFNDAVFDFHAGGFLEISLLDDFALQGELLYSRQGTENDARFTLNYISLPILAKLKFVREKVGLYAGPQVSYLISADFDADGFEGEASDFFKDIDIAAVIGGEFNLNKQMSIGARYLFSLSSIGTEYEQDIPLPNGNVTTVTVEESDVKNSVLQLYFGISF